MKNNKTFPFPTIRISPCVVAAVLLMMSAVSLGDYLKMGPPPDVDKADHLHGAKPTCWVAAGSNLLAAAGYGDGNNVQERADDIYDEICYNKLCDCNDSGWDDTAIQKWLQSGFNTQKNTNPYTLIRIYGNRDPRPPYARTDLPEVVGDNLRRCNFLSLSIREPTCDVNVGKGGHSIACWGDNGADVNDINSNPGKVKVSDSDYWDISVPVQMYTYDDYNNPNPNNCNEGVGWYIDYKDNHRYIDGFVTLEPNTNTHPLPRVLSASARFTYNGDDPCALDLHYKISSNKQLLSYRTGIDWDTNNSPTFTEDTNWVRVEWDLSDNPVPQGSFVNVTAEIIVPYDDVNGNSISIDSVLWTPLNLTPLPGALMWGRHNELPGGQAMYAPNMCGGYVVCACMIFADPDGMIPIGEYHWLLDYDYYQDPCHHEIIFGPTEPATYFMGFFRFGHSYGFLTGEELQAFSDWKTYEYPTPPFPLLQQRTFILDWAGQLPYPQGQDYVNPVPDECGDPGTFYYGGDINKDCKVDWQDFAIFAGDWLGCTDPEDPNCL